MAAPTSLLLNPNQDPIVVPNATPTSPGGMSAADKAKLDGLTPGSGDTIANAYITGGGDGGTNNTLGAVGTGMNQPLKLRLPTTAGPGPSGIQLVDAATDGLIASLGVDSGGDSFLNIAAIVATDTVQTGAVVCTAVNADSVNLTGSAPAIGADNGQLPPSSAGIPVVISGMGANGPGDHNGGDIVLDPGKPSGAGSLGAIDLTYAKLSRLSADSAEFRSAVEEFFTSGNFAQFAVVCGTVADTNPPRVFFTKDRTSGVPNDQILLEVADTSNNYTGVYLQGNSMSPTVTNVWHLGTVDFNQFFSYIAAFFGVVKDTGATAIVSNVLTPTSAQLSVGAGLIKTITVPFTSYTGTIFINPTGAFTYDATGNILVPAGGGTATINRMISFTYNGTKWIPSY